MEPTERRAAPLAPIKWDAATATVVIVLAALLFLVAVRRGFRGLVVSIGS